jgi:hypothetical protein
MALGGKLGIPLTATYSNSIDKMSYYTPDIVVPTETPPTEETSPTIPTMDKLGIKGSGAWKPNIAFFASAELGGKYQLDDLLTLYFGAFIDYGMSNIRPAAESALVSYSAENPHDYKPTSILTALPAEAFAGALKPLSVGIKVGIGFTLVSPRNRASWEDIADPKLRARAERDALLEIIAQEKSQHKQVRTERKEKKTMMELWKQEQKRLENARKRAEQQQEQQRRNVFKWAEKR